MSDFEWNSSLEIEDTTLCKRVRTVRRHMLHVLPFVQPQLEGSCERGSPKAHLHRLDHLCHLAQTLATIGLELDEGGIDLRHGNKKGSL